jgi:hypothetical protein
MPAFALLQAFCGELRVLKYVLRERAARNLVLRILKFFIGPTAQDSREFRVAWFCLRQCMLDTIWCDPTRPRLT